MQVYCLSLEGAYPLLLTLARHGAVKHLLCLCTFPLTCLYYIVAGSLRMDNEQQCADYSRTKLLRLYVTDILLWEAQWSDKK